MKVNETESIPVPVISGIAQRSVLGTILFVININDLQDNVKSRVFLFVDDTKVYQIKRRLTHACFKQISKLESWSEKRLAKFHPEKCLFTR